MAKRKLAKSTKTKNPQSKKLARIFNFSSTRGKFLVFMVSFAVIGGGYGIYHAFAAVTGNITYYYNSSGIKHDTGRSTVGYNTSYSINGKNTPIVAWQESARNTTNYLWYGPSRAMKVPSGYKGIKACFRYAHFVQGKIDSLRRGIYFDIRTSNGGGQVLKSTTVVSEANNVSNSNTNLPTYVTCLSHPAAAGTSFSAVLARVRVAKYYEPTNEQQGAFHIVRTSLEYYN